MSSKQVSFDQTITVREELIGIVCTYQLSPSTQSDAATLQETVKLSSVTIKNVLLPVAIAAKWCPV